MSSRQLLAFLKRDPDQFKVRLAQWMKACVCSMESVAQSSVQSLPRQFGDSEKRVAAPAFSQTEQAITRFDGGSELDSLREQASQADLPGLQIVLFFRVQL